MKRTLKYIFTLLLLVWVNNPIASQSLSYNGIIERTYITTDKECYVAGDNVWCSVYCFDITSGKRLLSNFSSIAYLELHSPKGVVFISKVTLLGGRGGGTIVLPSSLPTGNYALIAYTKQNRNEEGFQPEVKNLTIFNVFSTDRLDNVIINEGVTNTFQNKGVEPKNSGLSLSLPSEVSISSPFKIKLHNEAGEEVSCNVSIYHYDSLSFVSNTTMSDFFNKEGFNKKGIVSQTLIPDYEGEVIRFKVKKIQGGEDERFSNSELFVSSNDLNANIYCSKIEEEGNVNIFTGNIYGKKDVICEFFPSDTSFPLEIEEVSPFLMKYEGSIPPLTIDSSIKERLEKRATMMQIERRFGGDTLYTLIPKKTTNLLSENYKKYPLDNYTRFSSIEETFVEIIAGVRIKRESNRVDFQVLIQPFILPAYYSTGSALMLLDGVPIFNHRKLLDYDPLLLKEIIVYSEPYIIGNNKYEGVICFNTYRGNLPSFKFENNTKVLQLDGALIPYSFTGEKIFNKKNYPDYRQTIYWHPSITIPRKESLEIECYTPMYRGNFIIIVEGVTVSGEPIHYQSSFKVR